MKKNLGFSRTDVQPDIALLLEGSYPFMHGGVSAWVHQIILNFPQYNFALIFLGGAPENYKEGLRYELPKNVSHFEVHYLFEDEDPPAPKRTLEVNEPTFEAIKGMHDAFSCPVGQKVKEIGDMSAVMNEQSGVSYEHFLYSKQSWDYLIEKYTQKCEDASFIDYFWTIKNIHKPLWKLTAVLNNFPAVKVVHSISTGYAGLLSFLLHRHFQVPVLLTEHGIYTKERKIDIFLSPTFRDDEERALTDMSYLRVLWDSYFTTLSQVSYEVANPVVSLFSQAHQIQLQDGASPDKAIIIPNGINIPLFKKMRRPLDEKEEVICFIGRVVPVKDIKTFIRAVPNIHKRLPKIKVWIIGSTDQDPKYAKECVELVENTLLSDIIEFKPHMALDEILPKTKLVVLSSIRESMPLIILESMGAGVPMVVTDVGACKEMIVGLTDEDKALGPAGRVIKVADSEALEDAVVELLKDAPLWNQMSQSAIKRVEVHYDEQDMIKRYKALYEQSMKKE
jgi:glycosyltransferase involved in cell wall biosynthesis